MSKSLFLQPLSYFSSSRDDDNLLGFSQLLKSFNGLHDTHVELFTKI